MKKLIVSILVAAGLSMSARAEVLFYNFNSGFANGGTIPDGNVTGWSDTRTLSSISSPFITDVNVTLNLSGGYNGDLYAYLVHDGGFSVLLNRPGRTAGNVNGYGDSGLNITLDDSALAGDVHGYQSTAGFAGLIGAGGAWLPDGRNVSPLLVLDTDGRTRMLDQFNGINPNGSWTLFIADLSGGAQASVVSWGLNITAVPEPGTVAIFVLGSLGLLVLRLWQSRLGGTVRRSK